MARERIAGYQAKDVTAATDHHLGFKRQPTLYLGAKLGSPYWPTNYKGPGGTDTDNVEPLELLCQGAGAEAPVATYVDALEKSDEGH